jgi:membrane-associated phospholipid phosphatase
VSTPELIEFTGVSVDALKPKATVPVRRLLLAAALASLSLTVIRLLTQLVPLPFDPQYSAVVYLMWPHGLGKVTGFALRMLDPLSLILPLALVLAAAAPSRALISPGAMLRWPYSYAVVLPLVVFVSLSLSRLVCNGLYAAASGVSADYTPFVARLEGGLLANLQRSVGIEQFSRAGEVLYSSVWLLSLLLAAPLLLGAGHPRAVNRLLIGLTLAPILALPLFLLFPIYEPWALNPAYGFKGVSTTAVRFLALPQPSPQLLWITSQARWATGACLPSLHVTLPLVVSGIAFDEGARRLGWLYAAIGAAMGLTVVYLGRHWIVDVAAALLFAWCVAKLTSRCDARFVLTWPPVNGDR